MVGYRGPVTPADVPNGEPASPADDPTAPAFPVPAGEASVDVMQVLAARRRARQARPATDWDALVAAAQANATGTAPVIDDTTHAIPTQPTASPSDITERKAEPQAVRLPDAPPQPPVGSEDAHASRLVWGRTVAARPARDDDTEASAVSAAAQDADDEVDEASDAQPETSPIPSAWFEPWDDAEPEMDAEPADARHADTATASAPGARHAPAPAAAGPEPVSAGREPARASSSHAPDTQPEPPARALSWLTGANADDDGAADEVPTVVAEPLLQQAPRRRRRGLVATVTAAGVVVVLIVAYCVAALLWPVDGIAPTASRAAVTSKAAPAASVVWPHDGTAGITVAGMGPGLTSSTQAQTLASITKLVTILMVLDKAPLKLGEQGPSYDFTFADRLSYWRYLARNESALDVPVGQSLTEYQMIQGSLIVSASNYVARLARQYWPTDEDFAAASAAWLKAHHISGITLANATGFDQDNVATPAALLQLADLALKNPVVAQIVAQKTAVIPGVGPIENTNELLNDPGVIGLKTGTLSGYDVLAAKNVTVDGVSVRLDASVQNQNTSQNRWIVARGLFDQVQKQLKAVDAVPAGTVVGTVTLPWGAKATVKTTKDADVVLWNGASATTSTTLKIGDHRASGDTVGTLTAKGPVNSATVDVVLSGDLTGPDGWWRLTHGFALFGGN